MPAERRECGYGRPRNQYCPRPDRHRCEQHPSTADRNDAAVSRRVVPGTMHAEPTMDLEIPLAHLLVDGCVVPAEARIALVDLLSQRAVRLEQSVLSDAEQSKQGGPERDVSREGSAVDSRGANIGEHNGSYRRWR